MNFMCTFTWLFCVGIHIQAQVSNPNKYTKQASNISHLAQQQFGDN
jgi:hypothetical protein